MKKLLFYFLFVFSLLIGTQSVFASNLIETKLYYDGALRNYKAEEVKVSINGDVITNFGSNIMPVIIDGRTLVPARSVFENLGAEVNWVANEKKVTVNKDEDIIALKINHSTGTKNGIEFKMDTPAKIINDNTMIPLRAVSEALDCNVEWDASSRLVTITDKKLVKVEETYTETTTIENVNDEGTADNNPSNGIKIVWDQITNAKANDLESKKVPVNGLDVISPTWFAISNSQGDITDNGSLEYANWAHSMNYKIWGLITNSFDAKITHDTLSNPATRTKMINNIVQLADKYNLDGINVDFESVAKEDGDYYLQFIKELAPVLKQKGLVVSVDMYIPKPWTEHYHMTEVSQLVDYVIIMAYDEHWSTSPESGSVASLNWVDQAMKDASAKVDSSKLIMGVPFYTRKWAETPNPDGTVKVSSVSMKMEEAYADLNSNNANIIWDENAGQYYGEYIKEGITYKIWLEDERSIEEKMKVAQKYNVAGVAAWKRGHEKQEVWNVINNYFN